MLKLLHITPHLGGGVGQVLLNWLVFHSEIQHTIMTFDFANDMAKKTCYENGIALFSEPKKDKTFELIEKSDIVLVHFWNHPLLYDFFIRNELPKCRMIFWSHISGLEPPNLITEKVLKYPDKFVYTTEISREITQNDVILSTGGICHVEDLAIKPHNGFNVGYIGTVDYAKMHPLYVQTLSKTVADKVIVIGGSNEKDVAKNADDRFEFLGKVLDIKPYLAEMDVFGYLLNPKHFGTAEQVLQEALATGVVPVVLNNKCEKTLIKHNQTGLVANNLMEYVEYINLLKNDTSLREKLSNNGKKYAKKHFSLKKLTLKWNKIFEKIMQFDKSFKKWEMNKKTFSSLDVFKESLGSFADIFMLKSDKELKEILAQPNWQSSSKGTLKQYFKFLGGKELERICNLYDE